jgi:hypothetical protein
MRCPAQPCAALGTRRPAHEHACHSGRKAKAWPRPSPHSAPPMTCHIATLSWARSPRRGHARRDPRSVFWGCLACAYLCTVSPTSALPLLVSVPSHRRSPSRPKGRALGLARVRRCFANPSPCADTAASTATSCARRAPARSGLSSST